MLDTIKEKINHIRTDYVSVEAIKSRLAEIVQSIDDYQKSRATLSEVHAVFRTLDEYEAMYNAELTKYAAIPRDNKKKCSYQIQEMLCILAMMGALLTITLRKYVSAEDKSTLAKHLRKLNDINEYVKSEKIMWQSALKSMTVLLQSDMTALEYEKPVDE